MTRGVWAFIVGGVVVSACSSSSNTEDVTGACRAIAGACHKYDKGSGIGHDCHELGHGGDDNACAPKKSECLAACPVVDGGTTDHPDAAGDEGGVADGGADAQPDAPDLTCPNYCDCVGTVCSSQSGYPYADAADCLTKCKQLSAAETKCWTGMCESAKTSANKEHLCEHAWGKFGLDECE